MDNKEVNTFLAFSKRFFYKKNTVPEPVECNVKDL